ncbi:MAG: PilZ domain-containing protein [Spirochaetales bacterium]|nr:PilZ domain-containing protein [Spirochaetales bacterium]
MNERREYHRFLLHTRISYQSVKDKKAAFSTSKDISLGGVCITTSDTPMAKNDLVVIIFSLPKTAEEIIAHAKVMWSKPNDGLYDNGLMFTKISDKHRQLIEEFSIGSVEAE